MGLFDIQIVQIALSIIISWALFSILISLIQEAFAQIIAQRGRFMKDYLMKQLWDEANGINWANLIYMHGSIDLLTRAPNKPTNDIQPALFAKVFIEVLGNSHAAQTKLKSGLFNNPTLNNFKSAVTTLQQSDVVNFLGSALRTAELKSLSGNVSVDESGIYRNLTIEIENWYKEFIERLNLWYKKSVRKRLFFLGVVVALLVNVDSIQLFSFYQLHPGSRIVVQKYYENYINGIDSKLPVIGGTVNQTATSLDSLAKAASLPVGYDYNLFKQRPGKPDWLLWKIIGILTTAFAVSFGAPFWFDVLRKAYSMNDKIRPNAIL